MQKNIVILGGGYAGVEAALTLYKKSKRSEDISITLIDKNSYHTLLTELHEVAGNRIDEEGIRVQLIDIFKYTSVNLVRDEIKCFDFANNKTISDTSEYKYDYLVLAVGSEPNYFGIPGLKEHAYSLWSYNDAIKLRDHIRDCFIKASVLARHTENRKKLLTFAVGGGGFTGVEMIGELAHWVKDLCKEYNIPKNEPKLILIEALSQILSNLKQKSVQKTVKYLTEKLNVEILTNTSIVKAEKGIVELNDNIKIGCDTLIWTAGIRSSAICDGIESPKNKSCRLTVDQYTQLYPPKVYAIGDTAAFSSSKGSLPALVEAALQTAKSAAHNILADIRGKEKQPLKPASHGIMVSVGSYFAVSDIMGREWSRLISIVFKYLVNIHYLFGIGGFELVIRYLKHEFYYKKQDKTIIENHISVLSPSLWLVPIRLFLGYSWLKEGYTKLTEGWLVKPLLAGLASDATSGASVSTTGEKVFRIITENTPGWYAWIANHLVLPNALLFQILIVLAEIGIGLALASGTFTFIASIVSIGLIINFMLSTGFYDYNWWYIPAALGLLGGGGRAFGGDHYVMPWLMSQWRYFVRNKRIKLMLEVSGRFKLLLIVLLFIVVFAAGFIYNSLR